MLRTVALIFVVGALGAVATGAIVLHAVRTPMGGQTAVVVEVAHGARLKSVVWQLYEAKILKHPQLVYLWARTTGHTRVTQGTYKLSSQQSPLEILTIMGEGRVAMERFTLAEGLNRWQVRDLLVHQGWMSKAQFDGLCDDATWLRAQKIVGPSCDGFLYPETYTFARGTAPKEIFTTLFASYKREIAKAMANVHAPIALDEKGFVTLASIVEKETGAAHERPRIACVFYNRMRAKPPWKLETDPTVIYAATLADPRFNGNLTRFHLHGLESPYNTYRVTGLPPGPISNPGASALAAVARPADCEDFFFVSKNHGEHVFCPTLACHAKAVQTYQIEYFKRRRAAAQAAVEHPDVPHGEAIETAQPPASKPAAAPPPRRARTKRRVRGRRSQPKHTHRKPSAAINSRTAPLWR